MKSINPANGQLIKEYTDMSDPEVENIIQASQKEYLKWRETSFEGRSQLMRKTSKILKDRKQELARLMTQEMGKIYKEALSEIDKCAWACEYYAENAANFLADETVETDASKSFITYQPIGVVLAVMPWNFPFWQVFRFTVPNLMAGNLGILKHASNVPGCALAIESLFQQAGFPENLFRTLLIGSPQVERVIENPLVRAVTLTGSTHAGRAVAQKAGQCLKKTVLELGGSDPYIILEDANLDEAVKACVTSRLINAGQSCIAAKRFIIVRDVYDSFLEKFIEKMHSINMGDPMDEKTDIGPLASAPLREELHKQVQASIEQGASCLLGGEIPQTDGFYYPPTVLADLKKGMPAYEEELFGPVASLFKVRDENHAIAIANNSVFGLGGAVFTQDRNRGETIARNNIESGNCFVNTFVKSDPRLPFGGVKESGYGRELSHIGIREFTNIKTVYID